MFCNSSGGAAVPKWPFAQRIRGGLATNRIAQFNDYADDTRKKLEKNPYSETYSTTSYKMDDSRYGRPPEGSLTEIRGIAAGAYIFREIIFLCEVIGKYGQIDPRTGLSCITFGLLFDLYSDYSDKVVGLLLRARKYGLIQFPGEMLYQRRDEGVIISLTRTVDQIRTEFINSGDPVRCVSQKGNQS